MVLLGRKYVLRMVVSKAFGHGVLPEDLQELLLLSSCYAILVEIDICAINTEPGPHQLGEWRMEVPADAKKISI